MCGKYRALDETNDEMREIAEKLKARITPSEFEKISLFDVVPSSRSIAVWNNPSSNRCVYTVMVWGYPGARGRLVINARSETVFSSWFFRDSLPCVLPASFYYETDRNTGKRWSFYTDEKTVYLAGICRITEEGIRFVILTEEAGEPQNKIHERQPVMFDYEHAKKWCASKDPSTLLKYSIQKRYMRQVSE